MSARITPIGATEIEAARDYFLGLHTRLSDAWQGWMRARRSAATSGSDRPATRSAAVAGCR
jgi:hypothetical protein